jgi:hypothetical protein
MDDALRVDAIQDLGHPDRDRENGREIEPPRPHELAERRPVDVVQDQREPVA